MRKLASVAAVVLLAMTALAQDAASYLKNGAEKSEKGDHDGAIADFSRAIELDPRSTVALSARGDARRSLGDVDGAISDFTKVIEIDPRDAAAPFDRARARLASSGPSADVVADLKRAGELAKQSDLRDYVGLVLWMAQAFLGEERAASERLVADLALRPEAVADDWYAHVARFMAGRIDEAALLREAVAADGGKGADLTCEATFYAGVVRVLRGERAGAVALFDRCIATKMTGFTEFQDAPIWRARMLTGVRLRAATTPDGGVPVSAVEKGGPADRAGLRADDVVRSVGGKPVTLASWWTGIAAAKRDDVLRLDVVRAGQPVQLEFRLGRWE